MNKILLLILILTASIASANATPFNWAQTNGPTGGASFGIFRDSKGAAYVSTWEGRLYKNELGSADWQLVMDDVHQLLIDKNDNFYIKKHSDGSLNLFDSGLNFVKKIRTDQAFQYNALFTNAIGGVYVGIENLGLYYTTNKGDTWDLVAATIPTAIGFDSANASLYVVDGKRLGITRDNWQTSEKRTMDGSKPSLVPYNIEYNRKWNTWIALAPDSSLYVSADTGKTWSISSFKATADIDPLVVAPDGETYLADGLAIWVSHDGGYNWDTLFVNQYNSTVWSYIYRDNEILGCGNNDIIKYNFTTKKQDLFNDGLIISSIRNVVGGKEGKIYAVANNAITFTSDDGDHWDYLGTNRSLDEWFSRVEISSTGTIYARGMSVTWKSSDEGQSWKRMNRITGTDTAAVSLLHLDARDRFYGSGKGIYYSDDQGESWHAVNIPYFSNANSYSLASYEDKLALIINGANGDTLLYSENRGLTFRQLPIITHKSVNISCQFNTKGWFYCALNDTNQPDSLFVSTDDCKTFIGTQIPMPSVSKLKFDNNGYLYALSGAAANSTLYLVRTPVDGANWEYVVDTTNQKLKANDYYFDDNKKVYLGTLNDGVWKAEVTKGIPIAEEPIMLSLGVSPNPATEKITLRFDEDYGPAEITIYNQIGAVVFKGFKSGEEGNIEIPTTQFPIGAYFVKAFAGRKVLTGKFSVVR